MRISDWSSDVCSSDLSTGLTTPDIVTFLSNVAGLAREGVTHLAFEASSHGLSQYRTEGLPVRAAAFTNLSRDHLDYHKDMAEYFPAQMRLFSDVLDPDRPAVVRSEERRVGKGCVSTSKSRCPPSTKKKQKNIQTTM